MPQAINGVMGPMIIAKRGRKKNMQNTFIPYVWKKEGGSINNNCIRIDDINCRGVIGKKKDTSGGNGATAKVKKT